jgi:biotin carboxyl carrier protein
MSERYRREKKMAEVLSPLAGRIQEVRVKEGQMITEDDVILVIDARKMETIVHGDAGVVKEIMVKVNDLVEEDQMLAVVE